MAAIDFDKYFLHLPPFDRENDFFSFWDNSIAELKKIPITPEFHLEKKSSDRFEVYKIKYNGYLKSKTTGELLIPKKIKKPRVIIHIHDYNSIVKYRQDKLDNSIAYLFLKLRGHEKLPLKAEEEPKTPGYMIEHILDINTYYVKAAFLDVFRSIDVMRLNQELDCSKIGILGKGFGAAAALFAAAFSSRINAVVLETPSFCYLPMGQNLSTGDAAKEINNFLSMRKGKKKQIKKNLSYFDSLNFADKIDKDILTIVGLKDTISPPQCVFALFNHFKCEKTIEVYPDDGNDAGSHQQFKKSISWLIERITD